MAGSLYRRLIWITFLLSTEEETYFSGANSEQRAKEKKPLYIAAVAKLSFANSH